MKKNELFFYYISENSNEEPTTECTSNNDALSSDCKEKTSVESVHSQESNFVSANQHTGNVKSKEPFMQSDGVVNPPIESGGSMDLPIEASSNSQDLHMESSDLETKKLSQEPNKPKINPVNHDHCYTLPHFVGDVQHFTVVEGVGEEDVSITDMNYCHSRLQIPKGAVPLNAMKHILDLQLLVDNLKKGCRKCSHTLDMTQAQGVLPRGLGGFLYIRCATCRELNTLQLSRTHKNESSKAQHHPGIFDLNTKAASGKQF